jgi:hypothetical protein
LISDLDQTLKQLLIKKVPLDPTEVDVCFDMPDREWTSSLSKPTVNLYLYDIRENHGLRAYDWTLERNQDKTATRRRVPVRVDLSYLITVWTNAVDDEHRLLWYVLGALFRHPSVPSDMFQGELVGQDMLITTTVAQPDGVLKNPADFWGALDNRLKPAINCVVTIPLDLDVAVTAPMVSTRVVAVHGEGEMAPDERVEITGTVHEKGKPDHVIAGATLLIKEVGRTAKTDEQGRYVFRKLVRGSYTLLARAPNREERELAFSIPSKSYDLEL